MTAPHPGVGSVGAPATVASVPVVPRDHWIEAWERRAIIEYFDRHPLELVRSRTPFVDLQFGHGRVLPTDVRRRASAADALEKVFPAERLAIWHEMLNRVLESGRVSLDFELADGRLVALVLNAIRRDGCTVGVAAFLRDIEERRRAEAALRALPEMVTRAHEEERRLIAHDLHDGVLQELSALRLLVQSQGAALIDRGVIVERLDAITRAVRDVALRLRPAMLDDLGLLPAVRSLAGRVEAESGVQILVSGEPLSPRFHPQIETAGFRIVQEAVLNASRHASARTIQVALSREPQTLVLASRSRRRQGLRP